MTTYRSAWGLGLAALLLAACGGEEPSNGATKTPDVATVARGGALYDKYWKASDAAQPSGTHPLWSTRPDAKTNKRTGADTWRCKECHGWDYKGAAGVYAKGSHRTGFAGVLGQEGSEADILALLKSGHGYGDRGLSDTELSSLALFIREGLVDTSTSIDAKGAFLGDAERGKTLYMKGVGGNKSCKICHGTDGLKRPKGAPATYDDFVGAIAAKNPWEFLHKVRFGQPGTKMPAAHGTSASRQDLADLGAFAQTLPTTK